GPKLVVGHAEIMAGAEMIALSSQDDDADSVVQTGVTQGLVELVGHRRALRVALFGTVEDDACNARRRCLVADLALGRRCWILISHGNHPFWTSHASRNGLPLATTRRILLHCNNFSIVRCSIPAHDTDSQVQLLKRST